MATIVSDKNALMIMAFDEFTSQDVSDSLVEEHYYRTKDITEMALEIGTLLLSTSPSFFEPKHQV